MADRPAPLRVDGFAKVLVTDLVVRSKPFVGVASKVLGRLTVGERGFILEGPVDGAGYTWYRVIRPGRQPGRFDPRSDPPIGWVAAASRLGEPWLEGREQICPALPIDIDTLEAMATLERLSCFGSRTLTFVTAYGEFYDGFGPIIPWGTPEWLNGPASGGVSFMGPMEIKITPGVHGRYSDWARVTGHFDDPASATCRGGIDNQETGQRQEDPVEEQVVACRLRFVVTSWIALHQVQFRETLSGIANKYAVTLAALLAANPQITDPNRIRVGDFVTLPAEASTP